MIKMKYNVYILTDSTMQGHVNIFLYFVILIKILLCKICPWLTRKIILFDTLKKCHLIVNLQHNNWKNIELKILEKLTWKNILYSHWWLQNVPFLLLVVSFLTIIVTVFALYSNVFFEGAISFLLHRQKLN